MSAALRLHREQPRGVDAADEGLPSPAEEMSGWLDGLCAMLRLPEAERGQVRDELAWHLEERVRDLMVTGMQERSATARAIGELGDAGSLARRFHAAHTAPRRRRLMNMLMVGFASAAVLGGAVVMRPGQPLVSSAVFTGDTQPGGTALKTKVTLNEMSEGVMWKDFFAAVGSVTGKPVTVQWSSLRGLIGDRIQMNQSLGVELSGTQTLSELLEMLNSELELSVQNRIEGRENDGRLEFASTEFFDRRETRLVTYDVSALVVERLEDQAQDKDAAQEVAGEIARLVQGLVESENWTDNGGSRASVKVYGTKLFVRAPQRMLGQVEWVLAQAAGAAKGVGKQAAGAGKDDAGAAAGSAPVSVNGVVTRRLPVLRDVPLLSTMFATSMPVRLELRAKEGSARVDEKGRAVMDAELVEVAAEKGT